MAPDTFGRKYTQIDNVSHIHKVYPKHIYTVVLCFFVVKLVHNGFKCLFTDGIQGYFTATGPWFSVPILKV